MNEFDKIYNRQMNARRECERIWKIYDELKSGQYIFRDIFESVKEDLENIIRYKLIEWYYY